MGEISLPAPVKLFCGVLTSASFPGEAVREALENCFGPIDGCSQSFPFRFTDYYRAEMGAEVWRRFLSFRTLITPDTLADIKLRSNRLESELAARHPTPFARPVNLDPGYLEPAKVILASTKNFYHRLYLRDGIWAEVTLYYKGRRWQTLPWTFPDFRTEEYQAYFLELRRLYLRQLREPMTG